MIKLDNRGEIVDSFLNEWDFKTMKMVKEPGLGFAREIVEKFPNEFVGGIVYGPRRTTKSIYSLKVMMEIFMAFGCSEEDAWKLALGSMYFDIEKLASLLNRLAKEEKVWPVVTLDDAGVGAGSQKWFTDREQYNALKNMLDTVGTVLSGFILTTPTFTKIMPFIRDSMDIYRIKITKAGGAHIDRKDVGWERKATGYKIDVLPSGTIRIRSKASKGGGFVDEYSGYLINERYNEYLHVRLPYTIKTTSEALEIIRKSQKRKIDKIIGKDELVDMREQIDEALKGYEKRE